MYIYLVTFYEKSLNDVKLRFRQIRLSSMLSFHKPLPTKRFNMMISVRHLLHFIWWGGGHLIEF